MITANKIRELLKSECEKTGLRSWCRKRGINPSSVSNAINEKRPVSASMAEALGYEKLTVTMFRKINNEKNRKV